MDVNLSQETAAVLKSYLDTNQHPGLRVPGPTQQLDTGQSPLLTRAD